MSGETRTARIPRRVRWAAAWTLASALLVACLLQVEWTRALAAAASASPLRVLGAVASNLAIVPLWAAQWVLFLPRRRRIPLPRMLRITAVMAMVSNSVPFLAGQLTGFHLLARRGGVGYAASLSVTTLDQVAEGMAKLTLLALLGALTPLPDPLRAALLALALAVGALLLLALAGALRHTSLRLLARRLHPRPLATAVRFVARWAQHLEGVRRPRVLVSGYGLALAMKGAEAAGILLVQTALGVQLPPWSVLLVLAAVGLSTMVAVTPGNLGVYEASAFLAYRWLGVGAETALALAAVQHLAYLVAMGGAGWAAVTFRALVGSRPRDVERGAAHPPGAAPLAVPPESDTAAAD